MLTLVESVIEKLKREMVELELWNPIIFQQINTFCLEIKQKDDINQFIVEYSIKMIDL